MKSKKNFWKELRSENPGGIFALAPMADITDNPFRRIITEVGKPTVFFTEFVAVDGLASEQGREKLIKKILNFEKNQQPIIAQIFGGKPKNYQIATEICRKKGFIGIDINMGCPQKNIIKQGAGSDLINHPKLAKEIFLITKKSAKKLPVSIKTRIGFKEINLNWIKEVLLWKPVALTVHLRTQKEMSKVPAHWELMTEIREIRDKISPETILIGNGDIETLEEGREKIKEHQIDGIMIGRGIFKNPLLFAEQEFNIPKVEKIKLALKHTEYFDKEFPLNKEGKRNKNFALLKKFFKIYINGFDGAKELRMKMMEANSLEELQKICYN